MTNHESAHPDEQEPQLLDLEFNASRVEVTLGLQHTYDDLVYTLGYCGVTAEKADEKLDGALAMLFDRNSSILGRRRVIVEPKINAIGANEPISVDFRPEVTYREAVTALTMVCLDDEIARTKLREILASAINKGRLNGAKMAFKVDEYVLPDSDEEIGREMAAMTQQFNDELSD